MDTRDEGKMSDPVTNVEIEDVLSSIRRLVSTDPAATDDPQAGAEDAPDASEDKAETRPEDRPAQPKLVLTPAQRVNDDAPPRKEDAQDASGDDDAVTDETSDEGEDDTDQEVADVDPSDMSSDSDDDTPADDTNAAAMASGVTEDSLLQMVADEVVAEVEDQAKHDVQAQLSGEAPGDPDQEDAVDASEDGAFDHTDTEEAALVSEYDVAADEADPDRMSGSDVPEFLRRPVTQMDPPEDAEVISEYLPDAEEPQSDVQSLTSKRETLEQAVSEQAEDWEPDGGDDETLSPDELEPLPWTEVEAEMAGMSREDAATDPYAQAEAAQSAPWFGDDAVLDEDALRDMVGEIVRQELQGALGERITRNVRKLVRREIHRALMSQGLD